MRFLLVVTQVTVPGVPEVAQQVSPPDDAERTKNRQVAMAWLAVRLYWMMRKGWDYAQWKKFGSHAGQPEIAMVCSRTPVVIGYPAPRSRGVPIIVAVATRRECMGRTES